MAKLKLDLRHYSNGELSLHYSNVERDYRLYQQWVKENKLKKLVQHVKDNFHYTDAQLEDLKNTFANDRNDWQNQLDLTNDVWKIA